MSFPFLGRGAQQALEAGGEDDFERVFLPDLDASFPAGNRHDEDLIVAKGSVLYVAMSRARDRLPLSHTGARSMFLEPVLPFCDFVAGPRVLVLVPGHRGAAG